MLGSASAQFLLVIMGHSRGKDNRLHDLTHHVLVIGSRRVDVCTVCTAGASWSESREASNHTSLPSFTRSVFLTPEMISFFALFGYYQAFGGLLSNWNVGWAFFLTQSIYFFCYCAAASLQKSHCHMISSLALPLQEGNHVLSPGIGWSGTLSVARIASNTEWKRAHRHLHGFMRMLLSHESPSSTWPMVGEVP